MAHGSAVLWTKSVATEIAAMRLPSQLTLVCGARSEAVGVLFELASAAQHQAVSLSELALREPVVSSERDLAARVAGAAFLYDIETLCWQPWLGLDPIRFLRACSRTHGVVAVWPGTVSDGAAEFSAPGRRDYIRSVASGATILRARTSHFPDEVPFSIERIP